MKLIIEIPDNLYNLIRQSDSSAVAKFIDKEALMFYIKTGVAFNDILKCNSCAHKNNRSVCDGCVDNDCYLDLDKVTDFIR